MPSLLSPVRTVFPADGHAVLSLAWRMLSPRPPYPAGECEAYAANYVSAQLRHPLLSMFKTATAPSPPSLAITSSAAVLRIVAHVH
jgi:hypothetical protein